MITNADITIYNQKYNQTTRLNEWHRTVIKNVSFYHDCKAVTGEKGLDKATVYKIRIPESSDQDNAYVDEDEWHKLSSVNSEWTLQEGDIVVKGICDLQIEKPSDFTKQHKKYCKILSWSDNRRGTLSHWRIGGE